MLVSLLEEDSKTFNRLQMITAITTPRFYLSNDLTVELNDLTIIPSNYLSSSAILNRNYRILFDKNLDLIRINLNENDYHLNLEEQAGVTLIP